MKRSTLFAAITGAVLVGGGIYAITRATSSSTSSSASSPAPSASDVTPPRSTTTPTTAPTERSSGADPRAPSASVPATSTTTAVPANSNTDSSTAADLAEKNKHFEEERAAAEAVQRLGHQPRTGQNEIRKVPVQKDETPVQRQQRMTRTIEVAACQAPDAEARLAAMPASEGKRFQERCAAVGITLRAKPR